MLIVVRHGERCDLVTDPAELARITVSSDPPLTHQGLIMAQRTGARIKSLLSGSEPNLRIVTSPFLRCVETATMIAKSLEVEKLYLNSQASEFLNPNWYSRNPMDELIIHTPEHQATDLPLEELHYERPPYPETSTQMLLRYQEDVNKAIATWVLNGETVIVCSHGYYEDVFCSLFAENYNETTFCAISVAARKDDWVELKIAKANDHVSDLYSDFNP